MDEQDNDQQEDAGKRLARPVETPGQELVVVAQATNGHNKGSSTATPSSAVGPASRFYTVTRSATIGKTSEPDFAFRRTRLNRILMRKRRHERVNMSQKFFPRLMFAMLIVLLVILSLFSSSAGAAYAYYQSHLPLLNGIANHTLFQTTHIYDRNGHLLYELYDPQQDHGRRTYIDYKDISAPL